MKQKIDLIDFACKYGWIALMLLLIVMVLFIVDEKNYLDVNEFCNNYCQDFEDMDFDYCFIDEKYIRVTCYKDDIYKNFTFVKTSMVMID